MHISIKFTLTMCVVFSTVMNRAMCSGVTETCQTETFHAECASDEVIVMMSALYGRMNLGRCVKHDVLGYLGCQSDVLTLLDSMCSGRRSCNVRIPDPELDEVSQCLDELKSYLEASYTCYKVVAPMNPCSDTTPIKLTHSQGFLSSYIASTTGCGMEKAPWILQAKPGQLINITFYEFNLIDLDYRDSAATSAQCSERAFIMDNHTGRKIKMCPRSRRVSDVYVSANSTIDVTFRSRSILEEGNHFLIKYQFIGCEDPVPPSGVRFERTGMMSGKKSCLNSHQTFDIMCEKSQWIGEVGNCIEPGLVSQDDEESETSVLSGLLVVVLIAVCLILVSVIIGIFVFCIKRLRSHNNRYNETYMYEESPYGKGAKIHATQYALKQLHVEPCGVGETDTIYKPFLHKVAPPNGMIQNQINGGGGVGAGEPCLICSDNNRENAMTEEELNLRNAYSQHTASTLPLTAANPCTTYNSTYNSPKPPKKESNIDSENRFKTQKLQKQLQRKNSSSKNDRPKTLFGTSKPNKTAECIVKPHIQSQQFECCQYPHQINYDLDASSVYPRNYACATTKPRPREPIYVAPPSVDLLNNTL